MWILIVMVLAGSYHGGSAVSHVEFSTRERCEQARDAYVSTQDPSGRVSTSTVLHAMCVQK